MGQCCLPVRFNRNGAYRHEVLPQRIDFIPHGHINMHQPHHNGGRWVEPPRHQDGMLHFNHGGGRK